MLQVMKLVAFLEFLAFILSYCFAFIYYKNESKDFIVLDRKIAYITLFYALGLLKGYDHYQIMMYGVQISTIFAIFINCYKVYDMTNTLDNIKKYKSAWESVKEGGIGRRYREVFLVGGVALSILILVIITFLKIFTSTFFVLEFFDTTILIEGFIKSLVHATLVFVLSYNVGYSLLKKAKKPSEDIM